MRRRAATFLHESTPAGHPACSLLHRVTYSRQSDLANNPDTWKITAGRSNCYCEPTWMPPGLPLPVSLHTAPLAVVCHQSQIEGNVASSTMCFSGSCLQVSTQPRQPNGIDCGIYAGLQAEVICSHIQGHVRREGGALVCEGDHPRFLEDKSVWHTQNDVFGARLLLRAAAVAFWTGQSPVESHVMEAGWEEARDDLRKGLRTSMPDRDALW